MPLSRWNLNLKSTWRVLQTLQRLLRRQSWRQHPNPTSLPPPIDEPDTDDPEVLRQRAAARRKAEDQARQLELEAAAKARAEEAARQAEEKTSQPTAERGDRKPKRLHAAPSKEGASAPTR